MSEWRWPSPVEERAAFAGLRPLLGDELARQIAARPIVVAPAIAPLGLRIDAWCFRVDKLLRHAVTQWPDHLLGAD